MGGSHKGIGSWPFGWQQSLPPNPLLGQQQTQMNQNQMMGMMSMSQRMSAVTEQQYGRAPMSAASAEELERIFMCGVPEGGKPKPQLKKVPHCAYCDRVIKDPDEYKSCRGCGASDVEFEYE